MPRKPKGAAAPARRPSRARASVAEALVPFAHLMDPVPQASAPAPARAKARRAEDDRREDSDEEEERARGRRAEGDEDEDGDEDRREDAEEDDGEEGDDDDRDRARGRRTAAEDDDAEEEDEEQDEKDERDPKARAARSRERVRCGRILGSKAAAGRAAAANLACNTTMSASAAIKLLGTLPKQQAAVPGLGSRMADFGNRPSAAEPPAPDRKKAAASSWDAAMKRAGIAQHG